MTRTVVLLAALLALGMGASCSSSGSPSGSSGGDTSSGGGDSMPMGSAGDSSQPDSASDGGKPGMGDAGAPSTDPGVGDAGAPDGAAGAPDQAAVTEPDFPFDLGAAAAVLGGSADPRREVLDSKTTEFTLVGPTSTAVLDRTEWATAPEAEFECGRATNNDNVQVVGSDRMLFLTGNADYLSSGTACTEIRVMQGAEFSPTLTRDFAQTVLGAP